MITIHFPSFKNQTNEEEKVLNIKKPKFYIGNIVKIKKINEKAQIQNMIYDVCNNKWIYYINGNRYNENEILLSITISDFEIEVLHCIINKKPTDVRNAYLLRIGNNLYFYYGDDFKIEDYFSSFNTFYSLEFLNEKFQFIGEEQYINISEFLEDYSICI